MNKRKFLRRTKPENYGMWWQTNKKGTEWYEEIFNSRRKIHQYFMNWVHKIEENGDVIQSVLEVGCGRGIGYADFFKNKMYVGYDISQKEILWCKSYYNYANHDYQHGDIIETGIEERFDLVFSHALIDHIYDINAFIAALVRPSKQWIYITSYRGWFPNLVNHSYHWSESETCFYNDISAIETKSVLGQLGCVRVKIFPLKTENPVIPYETVIIGHV